MKGKSRPVQQKTDYGEKLVHSSLPHMPLEDKQTPDMPSEPTRSQERHPERRVKGLKRERPLTP